MSSKPPGLNFEQAAELLGRLPEYSSAENDLRQLTQSQLMDILIHRRKAAGTQTPARHVKDAVGHYDGVDARAMHRGISRLLANWQIHPDTWLAHFNILGFCSTWSECHSQLLQACTAQQLGDDWLYSKEAWAPDVLQRALPMVQSSPEARSALEVLDERISSNLSIEDAVECCRVISQSVYGPLRAVHLSTMMTTVVLRATERILEIPEAEKRPFTAFAKGRALLGYKFLDAILADMLQFSDPPLDPRLAHNAQRIALNIGRNSDTLHSRQMILLRLRLFNVVENSGRYAEGPHFQSEDTALQGDSFLPMSKDDSDDLRWELLPSHNGERAAFLEPAAALDALSVLVQQYQSKPELGNAISLALDTTVRNVCSRGSSFEIKQLNQLIGKMEFGESQLSTSELRSSQLKLFTAAKDRKSVWHLFRSLLESEQLTISAASEEDWVTIIRLVSEDARIDPEDVFGAVRSTISRLTTSGPIADRSKNRTATLLDNLYGAMIRGFAARQTQSELSAAIRVWGILLAQGLNHNVSISKAVVKILIRLDHTDDALKLIDSVLQDCRGDQAACTYFYHSRMLAYLKAGHFRGVYDQYREIPTGRDSNRHAMMLATLLTAAQRASEDYLSGIGHPLRNAPRPPSTRQNAKQSAARRKENVTWSHVPAAVRARDMFREHLFSQHPELREVINPLDWSSKLELESDDSGGVLLAQRSKLRARRSAGQMLNWQSWVAKQFKALSTSQGSNEDAAASPEEDSFTPGDLFTGNAHRGRIPRALHGVDINFDASLFHRYLLLLPLATSDIAAESAAGSLWSAQSVLREHLEVLAWMRWLDVQPLRATLLILCIHLDEVMPVLGWSSGPTQSAAGPLHAYLASWLGEDRVPSRVDIGWYVRYQERTKGTLQRQDIEADRTTDPY